jgi:hypothetical protein
MEHRYFARYETGGGVSSTPTTRTDLNATFQPPNGETLPDDEL